MHTTSGRPRAVMNPCADKFVPFSACHISNSSFYTFPVTLQSYLPFTISPKGQTMNKTPSSSGTSFAPPLDSAAGPLVVSVAALLPHYYSNLSLGPYAVANLGWTVAPWYDQRSVAGPFCSTGPLLFVAADACMSSRSLRSCEKAAASNRAFLAPGSGAKKPTIVPGRCLGHGSQVSSAKSKIKQSRSSVSTSSSREESSRRSRSNSLVPADTTCNELGMNPDSALASWQHSPADVVLGRHFTAARVPSLHQEDKSTAQVTSGVQLLSHRPYDANRMRSEHGHTPVDRVSIPHSHTFDEESKILTSSTVGEATNTKWHRVTCLEAQKQQAKALGHTSKHKTTYSEDFGSCKTLLSAVSSAIETDKRSNHQVYISNRQMNPVCSSLAAQRTTSVPASVESPLHGSTVSTQPHPKSHCRGGSPTSLSLSRPSSAPPSRTPECEDQHRSADSKDPAAPGTNVPEPRKATNCGQSNPENAKLSQRRVESGSWSQSKRWMSQNGKERMNFQRTMQNLYHIGADKSPFVPQNPAELTAFRAEIADAKMRRLSREVNRRIVALESKKKCPAEPLRVENELLPLLLGKRLADERTTVFASNNCFRPLVSNDNRGSGPWPSLAEFKTEGDKRANKYGRCFPLPMAYLATNKKVGFADDAGKASDNTHDRDLQITRAGPRFIVPVSPPEDTHAAGKVLKVKEEELPESLQIIIGELELGLLE